MIAKRVFDVCAALLLAVLLLPAAACVAVAVKLDSRGPVLFRQRRVGAGGRLFTLWKFRSMSAAPEGAPLTAARDARVTRVGAFLRRWRIDEWPQLLNVLRGDMSLVGPRPEVPRYVAVYPPALRDVVLSVRPGVTDEAAIQFRDEAALLERAQDIERAYIEQILPRKLALQAEYVRSRSFSGDLCILLRTVAAMFGSRQGASDPPGMSPRVP